jgi:hypothetical protein
LPLIVVVLAAAAAVVVVLGAEIAPTSGFKVAMAPVAMLSLARSLVECLFSSVAAAKNFSKSSFTRERERERERVPIQQSDSSEEEEPRTYFFLPDFLSTNATRH